MLLPFEEATKFEQRKFDFKRDDAIQELTVRAHDTIRRIMNFISDHRELWLTEWVSVIGIHRGEYDRLLCASDPPGNGSMERCILYLDSRAIAEFRVMNSGEELVVEAQYPPQATPRFCNECSHCREHDNGNFAQGYVEHKYKMCEHPSVDISKVPTDAALELEFGLREESCVKCRPVWCPLNSEKKSST